MIISIVSAVLIFAILIIVHEAGHFFVAKRSGVRVIRFSLGYPPKIFGIRRGQTEYAIGATPLGGYVRMLGDELSDEPNSATLEGYIKEVEYDLIEAMRRNGVSVARDERESKLADIARDIFAEEDAQAVGQTRWVSSGGARWPSDKAIATFGRDLKTDEAILLSEIEHQGSVDEAVKALAENRPSALLECFRAQAFPTQSVGRRIKIVLAGPIANIIFAPLLMAVVFMYGVPYLMPVVGQIKAGMPAATAGLQPGDRIVAINGNKIDSWEDLSYAIKGSGGANLTFSIERPQRSAAAQRITVDLKPKQQDEKTIYGSTTPVWIVGIVPNGEEGTRHYGPLRAIGQGFVATANITGRLVTGIAMIINGTTPAREALGGPIMIAQIAGKEASRGFADLAGFTVMLSIELGILNLLPVPLLDGGHLFFFLIEGVRGKPLQLRHREFAMQIGLLLLVALMTFVIANDITRIIHG